jgi:HAD superfamily hydrolase (TIGR01509 family)
MIPLYALPRRGFVFDMDGTLTDTETTWFTACGRFLKPYDAVHTIELQRKMMGSSSEGSMRIMQRECPSLPQGEDAIPRLVEERIQCFRAVRKRMGVKPMPGAMEYIAECGRRRIPLAIATSAFLEDAVYNLKSLGLFRAFEAIVTGDDVNVHKPAPDIYLEAARRLGVDPRGCTAFEDGEIGVQSALAAGMKVVFMWNERFHPSPSLDASFVARSFDELVS